jgi:hypothetical protein
MTSGEANVRVVREEERGEKRRYEEVPRTLYKKDLCIKMLGQKLQLLQSQLRIHHLDCILKQILHSICHTRHGYVNLKLPVLQGKPIQTSFAHLFGKLIKPTDTFVLWNFYESRFSTQPFALTLILL